MSSLRPLITIMLLAAVGVVLYMKINETEPVIPAGLPEWSAGPLAIGDGGQAAGPETAAPPAFAAGDAPAFTPGPVPSAAGTAAPAGDEAPAWKPEPFVGNNASSSTGVVAPPAEGDEQSSPVARTAEPESALPAMPPLPGSDAAASTPQASTAGPTESAPPFIPVETTPLAGAAESAVPADGAAAAPPFAASEPITPTSEPAAATTDGESEPGNMKAVAAGATAAVAAAAAAAAGEDEKSPAAAEAVAAPSTDGQAAAPPSGAASPAEEATLAKTLTYSSVRVAVQGALDRGELAQALLMLSDWYDDPSLNQAEANEVETLLSQLAGSVIYDGPPAHRLEQAYIVQAGETLQDVAAKYDVPWQLLAKINGVADPVALQPGQELKVVRGPFTAVIELGKRKMTLMLDRRYAGKFNIEVDPAATIEDGPWKVLQKDVTPAGVGMYGQPTQASEDRSLVLTHEADPGKAIVLRGPGSGDPAAPAPAGRVIRLKANDVADLYDILSEGSRVTVRR